MSLLAFSSPSRGERHGHNGVRAWIATWLAERRIRRDIGAVEAFDDALLHDIGVSRAGIEDAVRHGRARSW